MDISLLFFFSLKVTNTFVSWPIWIFIIRTGPKYEYSYNLTNIHENWAPPKKIAARHAFILVLYARIISLKGSSAVNTRR